MPVIDFTNPVMVIVALVLFLLCLFLGKNSKTNTAMCIVLLCFVTILVSHTIELGYAPDAEVVDTIIRSIVVDEVFTLVSFLAFLWLDRIQLEESEKQKKDGKKGEKKDLTNKEVKDGLDVLWKKI